MHVLFNGRIVIEAKQKNHIYCLHAGQERDTPLAIVHLCRGGSRVSQVSARGSHLHQHLQLV